MSVKLAELLVTDLIAYLGANYAAKVTALNAEYADSVVMVVPVGYFAAEQSLEEVASYPAAYVLVPRTLIPFWNLTDVDATHIVSVGIIVMDQNTEALRKQLYRHMRAVTEMLIASQGGGLNWVMDVGEGADSGLQLDFSPVYANGEVFVADAQVTVSFKNRNLEAF